TRDPLLDTSVGQCQRIFQVNFFLPFRIIQYFATKMRDSQVKGSFLNVSSISSFKAISRMAAYQSSKAALSMLSKGAALELAQYGIRVNTLSPGLTATPSNSNQWQNDPSRWEVRSKDIPLGRSGQPDDHAGAAVFVCSEDATWMTGADIIIDGGDSTI